LLYIVFSPSFNFISFFMIGANAVWMGFEADQQVESNAKGRAAHLWHYHVGLVFVIFFTVEVLLKIVALGPKFILGEGWKWNVFDVLLVLTSMPEFMSMSSTNLTFLRLIRILKLGKVIRLMRIAKFVDSLREIILAFLDTLGCLFWSFVTVAICTYMFALFFLQAVIQMLENNETLTPEVLDGFSSTSSAMTFLFSLITGGADWYPVSQGFVGDSFTALVARNAFSVFIFLMQFGFVNVILGIFCSKAIEAMENDAELAIRRKEKKYDAVLRLSLNLFNQIDKSGRGYITQEEFKLVCRDNATQLLNIPGFSGLGMFEMNKVWKVMAHYSKTRTDGNVDLSGFAMSILRFSGDSYTTEIVLLSMQMTNLAGKVRAILESIGPHDSERDSLGSVQDKHLRAFL